MAQPTPEPKNRKITSYPTYEVGFNRSPSFYHHPYKANISFEYGLRGLDEHPPCVTMAITAFPMTNSTISTAVDYSASDFLEEFCALSKFKPEDILKLCIVGTDLAIKEQVKDFSKLGINPRDIYTYSLERYDKAYLSPWQFCAKKQMILIPGFHT